MTNTLMVWGVVLLVGLALTHYAGVSEFYAWIAWLIIFLVGNMLVGKSMKKGPKEVMATWKVALALGAVFTIVSLAGLIEFNGAWLMGLWLLLFGAATFGGGVFQKNPGQIAIGLVWIVFGLWVPAAFVLSYFLVGGIVLGVPMIVSYMKK